jgi:hypothetical protein
MQYSHARFILNLFAGSLPSRCSNWALQKFLPGLEAANNQFIGFLTLLLPVSQHSKFSIPPSVKLCEEGGRYLQNFQNDVHHRKIPFETGSKG